MGILKSSKTKVWVVGMVLGGGTLSGIAQLPIPDPLRGYALLLPLQLAALLYVAYWSRRDRPSSHSTLRPSSEFRNGERSPKFDPNFKEKF